MTTTKVKTRKSDQLSLPGPEELFLYNSAKNIWMEGKALYFPGTRNTGQFTRKLWSIFLIQAKMVKSLNISCQQTQTLHRRPDELHRLKPFPPKRKRTNAHQVLGKLPKKRVLFFFYYFTLFYCIFPRTGGRSRSVRFRPVETSLSMHLWISFEYMFVVVQYYSWFRFYYPFLRDRNVW